jgi:hypothetical protein
VVLQGSRMRARSAPADSARAGSAQH